MKHEESPSMPPAGISGVDLVHHAMQRGWKAEDPLALAVVARRITAGDPVTVVQWAGGRDWLQTLPGNVTILEDLPVNPDPRGALVVISDTVGRPRPDVADLAILRPPTLALGVACRRGLVLDDLEEAFRQLCRREGFSPLSLTAVGASSRRRDLPALDKFAERRRLPMLYYSDAVLRRAPGASPSRVAGTCIAAATLAAGATETIGGSHVYFRKLTLALARRKS